MVDWEALPRAPILGGGGRNVPDFLFWLAIEEQKKGAGQRARELRATANWLLELDRWIGAKIKSERTEA